VDDVREPAHDGGTHVWRARRSRLLGHLLEQLRVRDAERSPAARLHHLLRRVATLMFRAYLRATIDEGDCVRFQTLGEIPVGQHQHVDRVLHGEAVEHEFLAQTLNQLI
jgi:hypothetical protein